MCLAHYMPDSLVTNFPASSATGYLSSSGNIAAIPIRAPNFPLTGARRMFRTMLTLLDKSQKKRSRQQYGSAAQSRSHRGCRPLLVGPLGRGGGELPVEFDHHAVSSKRQR